MIFLRVMEQFAYTTQSIKGAEGHFSGMEEARKILLWGGGYGHGTL